MIRGETYPEAAPCHELALVRHGDTDTIPSCHLNSPEANLFQCFNDIGVCLEILIGNRCFGIRRILDVTGNSSKSCIIVDPPRADLRLVKVGDGNEDSFTHAASLVDSERVHPSTSNRF